MHVSYRRPVELFVGSPFSQTGINSVCAGRKIVTLGSLLHHKITPKSIPGGTNAYEIDLIFHSRSKSGGRHLGVLWASQGTPRRDPGTPRRAPGTPRRAPEDPQEPPEEPQEPPGTHREAKPIYKYFIGSGTPDSSPLATRMLIT